MQCVYETRASCKSAGKHTCRHSYYKFPLFCHVLLDLANPLSFRCPSRIYLLIPIPTSLPTFVTSELNLVSRCHFIHAFGCSSPLTRSISAAFFLPCSTSKSICAGSRSLSYRTNKGHTRITQLPLFNPPNFYSGPGRWSHPHQPSNAPSL